MGFDVSKFIAKVEEFASKLPGSTSQIDGKLDAFEKASLFNNPELLQELKTAVENSEYPVAEANAIFGLELSPQAAARRAGGDDDGDGGDGGDGNNDVTIIDSGDGGVHITINNSSNWSLTINISTGDAANIKALLDAFLAGIENITQNMLDTLIEFLKKDNDNIFQLLNQLFTLLADNSKLQISTLQDILAALNQLGIKIDGATEVITKLLQAQLEALQDFGINMDELVEQVKINNEKQDQQNEILTMILDAVSKFADQFGNYSEDVTNKLNAFFAMFANNSAKYDDMIAILQAIKDDTSEGNKISKAILDAMNKIDAHFGDNGNITELLKQIAVKEVTVKLDGDSVNVSIDVDAILAKLDTLIQNTNTNNELQQKILEKLSNIEGKFDVDAILDALLKAGDNLEAKFDEITKLLETINTNIVNGNEQAKELAEEIIKTINELGYTLAGSLNSILEAVGGDAAKLQEILDFLKTMDTNNETRNKAILDAIAKVGVDVIDAFKNLQINVGDVSIGDINLQEVIDAINENTVATNNQGNNANYWLETLFGLISAMYGQCPGGGGEGGTGFNITIEQLKELLNNLVVNLHESLSADLSGIMDLLQQILDAIKNGEFHISVDVNGDCHCGTGGGGVNEGENDDMGALFSPRRSRDMTGINTATGEQSSQGAKKVVLNGQYGGLKGAYIVKDNGDGTVTISNLGGQVVRNHVPKE